MSNMPLVSILTPCYNGSSYVDRYFETVMGQTYSNIELIFVDDGSTDDTYAKAEAWREKLQGRGIAFKLLTHPNGGQASAINLGLPEVTGKYVTWPDCDDLMHPRNIELKVEYLEAHPEKGLVVCDVAHVLESDLDTVVDQSVFDDTKPRLFDGLIREKRGTYCSNIAYLVRAEALFSCLGGRHIYDSRAGQNWALLFPLTYHYDCGFIHSLLATYVLRPDSLSHSAATPEGQMRWSYGLEDIIGHVLPIMGMTDNDFQVYSEFARVKYLPIRFTLAVKMGDKESAKRFKDELDKLEGFSRKRDLLMLACSVGLSRPGYVCLRSAKRALAGLRGLVRKR